MKRGTRCPPGPAGMLARAPGGAAFGEEGARPLDVTADLLHERLRRVEAQLLAQARQEGDLDRAAVEIRSGIEKMRLDREHPLAERRPSADVGHRRHTAAVEACLADVDAGPRPR